MREAAARQVLLVQAVEETDTEGELLLAAERAEATRLAREAAPDDPAAMAARRAARLCERLERRGPWCSRALRLTRFPGALPPLLLTGALALGLLSNALGPERRINILSFPLLGLLAWNLAVYLGRGVQAVRRLGRRLPPAHEGGGTFAALLGWWMERARRGGRDASAPIAAALALYSRRWLEAAAPLIAARARLLLDLGAAAAAGGAVLGMYVRGIAFEYHATWESTFLGAEGARLVLGLVLGPAAALLGVPLPDADGVQALRAPAVGDAAPWIHRYAVTALLVVVVPRLALASLAGLRARRLARRFPLDLGGAYFLRLFAAARGQGVRIDVLPYSYEPTPRSLDRLRGLLHQLAGARADVRLAGRVDWGAEPAAMLRTAGLDRADGAADLWLVVLFTLAQTPEPEVHGELLASLAAWVGQDGGGRRLLLVTDAAPYQARLAGMAGGPERLVERRSAWDLVARGAGLGLAHLELDRADEDAALGRLQRALWPAAPVGLAR